MAGKSGPRGPYAKTARVREGIIEAATAAFSQAGFHSATMKDIAERSGISQRGLVHHFESKDELLVEVLKHREIITAKELAGVESGGVTDLLRVLQGNLEMPGLVELHTVLTAEAANPEHPAHEHYLTRYKDFRGFVSDMFAIVQRDGNLVDTLTPDVAAQIFIATMEGLQTQWLYDKSIDVSGALAAFLNTICLNVFDREQEHDGEEAATILTAAS